MFEKGEKIAGMVVYITREMNVEWALIIFLKISTKCVSIELSLTKLLLFWKKQLFSKKKFPIKNALFIIKVNNLKRHV